MLKLRYFGYLMLRANSLKKTLMQGKIEGRRRGRQRMRCLDGIIDSMDMSLSKLQKMVKTGNPSMLQSMGFQRVGHNLTQQQQVISSVPSNLRLQRIFMDRSPLVPLAYWKPLTSAIH